MFKKIFAIFRKQSAVVQEPDILFPGLVSAKQYAAFKPDQRMQAVMIVGDAADVIYYDFIKWCVENDTDQGVRFAALKRLPNYSSQADLRAFLERLDKLPGRIAFEPYLSMALSKVGLITDEELNARLNTG